MEILDKNKTVSQLTILYILAVVTFSFLDLKSFPILEFLLGSIRIPLLILMYFLASKVKSTLYFSALILFFFAYLFFRENTPFFNFIGAIISLAYRILIFIIVYKSIENKNWLAIVLASIPFFFIYLYALLLIEKEVKMDFYPWVINGFLTSFIGGMATFNFLFQDKKRLYWLFISAILFVIQIGVFLINKYYFPDEILRMLTIILFGISNFTFYKFVLLQEELKLKYAS
ncbi:hypothetical protein [Flavobacterium proteolyticum]|uniref:YhhN-like protein n=1 Tax=Flavobacterium proteolyticum TaxID=2911683 RepID=A0ABR9WPG2_9FLAO|nr:hypothetical protein [Flavobacterium proteolyticum]MBE9575806.1 hypothetical protein [Flavobacterium proteolyticum]